ncbi:heme NO-binding domain-containing protein [Aureitalea sp. L0-47]|uniref:heme NO-binding domain-containing protein n=1 Tax=Aureitalea sp. L0-47 TaxID=2816962 RepID=UPI00223757EE|nr:heme NO-binding domain-containing protein [Aureitalea sp. L0-47]MCW5518594.1 heme NO-binding domain-containing protein [Aureitalea sp. L0-47]
MKGIIFTEFLDLVETKFGIEMVDKIISQSELESGGVYTSVGTYDFGEMLQLVTHLSNNTDIAPDDLLLVYGEHLFSALRKSYPELIESYKNPLDLLASIENHIHIEVRKIYPDAELPTFEVLERTEDKLVLLYKSSRALYSLGLGLMQETFAHFNTTYNIEMQKLNEEGTEVRYSILSHAVQ